MKHSLLFVDPIALRRSRRTPSRTTRYIRDTRPEHLHIERIAAAADLLPIELHPEQRTACPDDRAGSSLA